MMFLMTGVPGAGKTLNTIKFINEDSQFKDRPVFYHNIRELKKSNNKGVEILKSDWTKIDDEQAFHWFELPKGSVVIFDECQDLFPVNTTRKGAAPEYLSHFTKHRHLGIDVVLITQEPRNIDSFVRRLIGVHRHHSRHFGTSRIKIYEWQNRCCENVHDYHEKKDATLEQTALPKKYYGVYYSAEVHTHKARIPWFKLGMILIPALAIPLLISYFITFFFSKADSSESVSHAFPIQTMKAPPHQRIESKSDYFKNHTPRIDGLPFTAPVFDEIREVNSYPWPTCIASFEKNTCLCHSQQSTRMDIPLEICFQIVSNGMFDYSKEERNTGARLRSMPSEQSRGNAAASLTTHKF